LDKSSSAVALVNGVGQRQLLLRQLVLRHQQIGFAGQALLMPVFQHAESFGSSSNGSFLLRNAIVGIIILTNGFGVVLKYANMTKDGTINMGFPSYYLINKQGTIQLRAEGWDKSQNLDAQISKLLTE